MATRTRAPKTTVIADDPTQDEPQTTSAGDAPADTYDPKERVSSVKADKAAAAAAGHQTVNAVTPVDGVPEPEAPADGGRTETVIAYGPDGVTEVSITRNIDLGTSEVATTGA